MDYSSFIFIAGGGGRKANGETVKNTSEETQQSIRITVLEEEPWLF